MELTPKALRHLQTLVATIRVHNASEWLTARNLYVEVAFERSGVDGDACRWLFLQAIKGLGTLPQEHPAYQPRHRDATNAYKGLLRYLEHYHYAKSLKRHSYVDMLKSSAN